MRYRAPREDALRPGRAVPKGQRPKTGRTSGRGATVPIPYIMCALMRLVSRYLHPTPHGGQCRVRIYLPGDELDAPVVICSELPNNPGDSVTDAAQAIAAEVVRGHRLRTPMVWIEHYPPGARRTGAAETFELVSFSDYEVDESRSHLGERRLSIGEPDWKPLDRATVEALVGRRV